MDRTADKVMSMREAVAVTSPYPAADGTAEEIYAGPPVHPDVTIIHAQRADRRGNTRIGGLTGVQAEAVHAAEKAVVGVEEPVADEVVRADPNRAVVPAHAADAVAVRPRRAQPGTASVTNRGWSPCTPE